jgi:hypothetical protein
LFQVINNDEDVIMLGERRGEGDTETDTQMYATSDVSDTDHENMLMCRLVTHTIIRLTKIYLFIYKYRLLRVNHNLHIHVAV